MCTHSNTEWDLELPAWEDLPEWDNQDLPEWDDVLPPWINPNDI